MQVMDNGLIAPHVVAERIRSFEDYVRGQSLAGYPGSGLRDVALYNFGHTDYFGPVTYNKGMYHGKWIVPDNSDNAYVLLFRSREEALAYGRTLLPIFPKYGYFHCRVCVDAVVVYLSFPTGFVGSLANTEIYDDQNYHVLRIRIKK